MATLNDFSPSVRNWLAAAWNDRRAIMGAARQRGHVEGAWQVYDRYNPAGRQAAPAFFAFLVTAKAIVRAANQRGQGLRLHAQGGDVVPNNFFHFLPVPRVGGAAFRIYIHTQQPVATRALPIVSMVLELMQERPGIDEVKIAGPGMDGNRRDTIVIYIRDEMLVPWMIRQLRTSAHAASAVDPVPSGTKRVAAGISWAEEPPRTHAGDGSCLTEIWGTGRHSYGSYLAGCIYRALYNNPHTPGEFLDFVIGAFEDAGVDPHRPHVFERPAPPPLLPDRAWLAMKGIAPGP